MSQQNLKSILESLLFVASKPLRAKNLSALLNMPKEDIETAFTELKMEKQSSGVVVLENNGEFQLATNSENSTQVKNFLNTDLREKLTEATVEVLSIIAYRQPISKAEIEAIRGVNSQYSLRHLLMRGLIEKVQNPSDQRSFLYQTTTEMLQHLGLTSVSELPDFNQISLKVKLPETPALENQAADIVSDNPQITLSETPTTLEKEITPTSALELVAATTAENKSSSFETETEKTSSEDSKSDDEFEDDEDEDSDDDNE